MIIVLACCVKTSNEPMDDTLGMSWPNRGVFSFTQSVSAFQGFSLCIIDSTLRFAKCFILSEKLLVKVTCPSCLHKKIVCDLDTTYEMETVHIFKK